MVVALSPSPAFQFDLQPSPTSISISCRHRAQKSTLNTSPLLNPPIHHRLPDQHYGRIEELCYEGRLGMAMEALFQTQTRPSEELYHLLLKTCGRKKDTFHAKLIFSHMEKQDMEISPFLEDYLVVTLAKCGALEEAFQALKQLRTGTVFSYTAMISCYHERGLNQEAFSMYEMIQKHGIEPDRYMFVSLIRICANTRDLQKGREFHDEADRRGYGLDVFVANSLVTMYGKCRSIREAEKVFVGMLERNLASWTSMMSAYVQLGQFKKTLLLYRQMLEENINQNQHTYSVALQACYGLSKHMASKLICLDIVHALHTAIHRNGLGSNVFVATSLMNIYGRCGRINEAENVFTGLPQCDIVAWNAMLCSYIEEGQGGMALRLYKYMQEQGVPPDQKTFVMALQACVLLAKEEEEILIEGKSMKVMSMECFRAIHSDAKQKGFASNSFFGTTLLGMYAKSGMISEAENVFFDLSKRDVVSWTAMLTAYLEQGQGLDAILLYRQMQDEGVDGNEQTYVVAIQACGVLAEENNNAISAIEIGMALHADAKKKGFDSNVYVATSLLGMYAICGTITEAESIFDALPQHDVVAWNAMLTAYVNQGYGHKALQLYRKMLVESMNPNQKTFVIILNACSILVDKEADVVLPNDKTTVSDLTLALHADLWKWGFTTNVFIGNTLVAIYGKLGNLKEAKDVFMGMSWHETTSWNAMFSACIQHNEGEEALELYTWMKNENAIMNDVTHLCLLQACGATGSLEICQEIHFSVVSAGYDLNLPLVSTLIHAYGNCSSMEDARSVFQGVSHPDIVSWNACIAGFAGDGNYEESVRLLDEMDREGIEPDGVTLASVLSACSHGGLVARGVNHFEDLCKRFNIIPDLKHYSTIIDLLGRAGDLKMLEGMLGRIPLEADLSIWLPLLGACRMHGNKDLGKHAFANAIDLKPTQASAYIIMSNIYANSEFREDSE